jgi:glucose/mannose-6-phosphate isomerase
VNLDDLAAMQKLDSANILAEIDDMPAQFARGWTLAQDMPLPDIAGLAHIVISGMGTPGIAADLMAGYAASQCPLPILVHHDYGLPAFANGAKTLFIACDHSGNNEETLDSYQHASQRGCAMLIISTGGRLVEKASVAGYPVWRFLHKSQPHASLPFSFALLLAVFSRLGLLPHQDEFVAGAIAAMSAQKEYIKAAIPAANNPAKRYAGQLVGRWVTIFGSGTLAAVARHWKNQINELAKAPANAELLPEANHNSLAGTTNPSDELLMPHTLTLFLRAPSDHPRIILRTNITRQVFMIEGLNTDFYLAQGENSLAHMWTAIHFGEYMAYYLAIAYNTDPTSADAINSLQASLNTQK